MAFTAAPNTWFDSWSEDGTKIEVPIATFPELTAGEADGATGDIRKVLYALMEKLVSEWNERAPADRPGKMDVVKGSTLNPANNQITAVYQISFVLAPSALDVAAES